MVATQVTEHPLLAAQIDSVDVSATHAKVLGVILLFVQFATLASKKWFELKGLRLAGLAQNALLLNPLLCNRFSRIAVTHRAKIEITPIRIARINLSR